MRSTSTGDGTAAEGPAPGDSERLYRAIRSVATPLYRGLLRVKVEHRERVPDDGGAIVASNHISFFDSVALLQSIPRRAFFIGKAEYMHSWTTRRLFPAMGLIPIEREQARKALAALEVAASVLHRGDVLTIYPEGTRSRDGLLHKGHTGVAQLALMSGAPIVPVGLVGTDQIQPIGSPRAASVPAGRRPLRRAARPRRLRRIQPAPPADADRRPHGGHPPAVAPGGERRLRQPRATARAGRDRERVPGAHAGGVGATFAQAARFAVAGACSQFDDGRVGSISRLGCRIQPDGTVRFEAEVDVSVKYQPQELRS